MNRAALYARTHRAVDELLATGGDNDKARHAYMIARIALLHIRATHGPQAAAEKAFKLADELATEGMDPS